MAIKWPNNFTKEKILSSWRPFLLLFIAILLVHGQSLFFSLTYLDDSTLLAEQSNTILNLSFFLESLIGGHGYFIYHLFNLLWHFAAVALVFVLLKKISGKKLFSFLGALILAIHPVLSQAVAWIPGRNDSMLAVFILSAFLFFLHYVKERKAKWLFLYALFFLISILTKENAIVLPILVFVYLFLFRKECRLSFAGLSFISLLSLSVVGFYFSLRYFALGSILANNNLTGSFLSGLISVVPMIAKTVLPFNLSVLPTAADTGFIWFLIALFLIVIFYIYNRRQNWNILLFGLIWLLAFLLPSLAVSDSAPFLLEHRLYLPFVGCLIIMAASDRLRNASLDDKYLRSVLLFILVIFSFISLIHSRKFSDPIVFWRSAVASSPSSSMAYKNLGVVHYLSGDVAGAERNYNMALKLNSKEVMVNNNPGLIYMNRGDYWRAETAFFRELEINPDYDKALANLSELYSKLGDYKKAGIYALELERVNLGLNKTGDSLK